MSTEATESGNIRILTAGHEEAPYVAGLIAAAFHPLDAARWQIEDDELRRAVFPAYFQGYVAHAMGSGVVQVTEDRLAAALWLAEDGEPQPEPERPDPYVAAMLGEKVERLYEFDVALHAALPTPGRAFEHLAILAVLPGRQGQGIGTAMVRHRLAHLDQAGTPAYLEASDEDTRRMYRRFGFEDHGEPIRLPGGPLMYPMWREPSPRAR